MMLFWFSGVAYAGSLTTLVTFYSTNGALPSSIIQASDGNFYGTTAMGGTTPYGKGTIFKITPDGILTTLFVFRDANDGFSPRALIEAADGNFYGTTDGGGSTNQNSGGTVFKAGKDGSFTTLFRFNGTNGANPSAALIAGADGAFYGSTIYGGVGYKGSPQTGVGTVFRVTTNGELSTLFFFDAPVHGVQPIGRLLQLDNGDFLGVTRYGGTGTNLYYLGEGTVFRLGTNGSLSTLVSFNGTNGSIPSCGLVTGLDWNLYGVTTGGGAGYPGIYSGTAFQLTSTGELTTLHSFTGWDGVDPLCEMVKGPAGKLYGTTGEGMTNAGSVFMLSTNGTLTTIYTFTGGNDGYQPSALILAKDGNLYGATASAGAGQHGTIFRLDIAAPIPVFNALTSDGVRVNFSWSASVGQVYQLQYSTNLEQNIWIDSGPPLTATNSIQSSSDVISSDSNRFYRIRLSSQ